MKLFLIISLFLFPFHFANACSDIWKTENAKNPLIESCRLDSVKGGIELVQLKKGCAFPGPETEPCFILRSCGPEKELGASVFRKSSPLSAYCLSGKEQEVMGSSTKVGVKAFITCSGVGKPSGIRLETSNGKSKTCPFPFHPTTNQL